MEQILNENIISSFIKKIVSSNINIDGVENYFEELLFDKTENEFIEIDDIKLKKLDIFNVSFSECFSLYINSIKCDKNKRVELLEQYLVKVSGLKNIQDEYIQLTVFPEEEIFSMLRKNMSLSNPNSKWNKFQINQLSSIGTVSFEFNLFLLNLTQKIEEVITNKQSEEVKNNNQKIAIEIIRNNNKIIEETTNFFFTDKDFLNINLLINKNLELSYSIIESQTSNSNLEIVNIFLDIIKNNNSIIKNLSKENIYTISMIEELSNNNYSETKNLSNKLLFNIKLLNKNFPEEKIETLFKDKVLQPYEIENFFINFNKENKEFNKLFFKQLNLRYLQNSDLIELLDISPYDKKTKSEIFVLNYHQYINEDNIKELSKYIPNLENISNEYKELFSINEDTIVKYGNHIFMLLENKNCLYKVLSDNNLFQTLLNNIEVEKLNKTVFLYLRDITENKEKYNVVKENCNTLINILGDDCSCVSSDLGLSNNIMELSVLQKYDINIDKKDVSIKEKIEKNKVSANTFNF